MQSINTIIKLKNTITVFTLILINFRFFATAYLIIFLMGCGFQHNKNKTKEEITKEGADLYSKYGCVVCHSIDGKILYGPPLNDVFMKEITVLRNGKEINVLVNREYLKKAITQPPYEKVLEYKSKDMPLTFFTDEEVDILVEYIVGLSEKYQIKN